MFTNVVCPNPHQWKQLLSFLKLIMITDIVNSVYKFSITSKHKIELEIDCI